MVGETVRHRLPSIRLRAGGLIGLLAEENSLLSPALPLDFMEQCAERDKLKAAAATALKDIINFADRLRKALGSDDPSKSLTPLDKDLEIAVGSRERAFGALAQHCKEHGCEVTTVRKLAKPIAK